MSANPDLIQQVVKQLLPSIEVIEKNVSEISFRLNVLSLACPFTYRHILRQIEKRLTAIDAVVVKQKTLARILSKVDCKCNRFRPRNLTI
jgi:hypothetical protein